MNPRLGLVLSQANVRRLRRPVPDASVVLLERTLYDPPRAAAARRWGEWLRRSFPAAELIPYAWHLVTHAPEDGLRARASRSLEGPPHAFGLLQDTREVALAWEASRQVASALGATRIALRTPPGLAPGPLGRRRLEAFVRRHPDTSFVWDPRGLWTGDEAAMVARDLGLTVVLDALDETPEGSWLRVEPLLRKSRLDADQTDRLLDLLETRTDVLLLFAGPAALSNLREVRDALG
jgi:hypothetical protein